MWIAAQSAVERFGQMAKRLAFDVKGVAASRRVFVWREDERGAATGTNFD